MPCCFYKKPKQESQKLDYDIIYYRTKAKESIDKLSDDYAIIHDPQGGVFSITHKPTGHIVNSHAESGINYWVGVIATIERIEDVVAKDVFKP